MVAAGGGFLARDGQEGREPASNLPHRNNPGRPAAHDLAVHAVGHGAARELGVAPAAAGYASVLDRLPALGHHHRPGHRRQHPDQ